MRKNVGHWAFLASLELTLLFGIGVALSLLLGSNAHPILDVATAVFARGFIWLLPLLVLLALFADRGHPGKVTICGLLFGLWVLVMATGWWIVG